jgi:hypothetical protein
MLVLLCTMAHSIIRQIAINTQNIIVLTLEFTNYSFFAAKENPFPRLPSFVPAKPLSIRRLSASQSGMKYTIPTGAQRRNAAQGNSNPDCTLWLIKAAANRLPRKG